MELKIILRQYKLASCSSAIFEFGIENIEHYIDLISENATYMA